MNTKPKLVLPFNATALVALLAAVSMSRAAWAEEQQLPVFHEPEMTITAQPRLSCTPAKPIAPDQVLVMGLTGAVQVQYTIAEDGRVRDVALLGGSAHPILGDTVQKWLNRCWATPFTARAELNDGHAVRGEASKTYSVRIAQSFVFKR
jgi:hypothetical protein